MLILGGYVFLAVLAVALTDDWIGVLADKNAQIEQNRDSISALEQLRTDLMQAESIQRGYLLTGRDSYIVSYDEAIKHVRTSLHVLESKFKSESTQNHSRQHDELLKHITANLEGKLTEMQMAVSLAHDGSTEEALKVINTDEGLVKMANFFNDTHLLIEEKMHELENQLISRDRLMLAGRASVWASVLIVLILVVLVVKKLLSEILNRDRKSVKLEHEVSGFEQQLEERTQQLKILAVDYQYDVERERRKLARELHDELGSILTATKIPSMYGIIRIAVSNPFLAPSIKAEKTSIFL